MILHQLNSNHKEWQSAMREEHGGRCLTGHKVSSIIGGEAHLCFITILLRFLEVQLHNKQGDVTLSHSHAPYSSPNCCTPDLRGSLTSLAR
jgi:hypothetical protein